MHTFHIKTVNLCVQVPVESESLKCENSFNTSKRDSGSLDIDKINKTICYFPQLLITKGRTGKNFMVVVSGISLNILFFVYGHGHMYVDQAKCS